jgi:hypothetical protein
MAVLLDTVMLIEGMDAEMGLVPGLMMDGEGIDGTQQQQSGDVVGERVMLSDVL